jgi:Na+/proline symporter
MARIDGFTEWFPRDLALPGIWGPLLFAVSWGFAGLSVIGQPHIMVRFMSLDDSDNMQVARAWYYLWFIAFYAMATCVGLLARIHLGDTASFDAELALPTMAVELMPPVMVGLILAGIFAATMSTADSLVLSCSAALTHDLLPHRIEHALLIKLGTVFITAIALGLALMNNESVFNLVILSWSALASAFAPLLIAQCLGQRPTQAVSLAALSAGLATALLWRYLGWHTVAYEGLPGILVGLGVLILATRSAPSRHRMAEDCAARAKD